MPYDIIEPENATGYEVLEPVAQGYDILEPDKPGAIEGTANEFKRGLLAGQQVIAASELANAPKAPTMRQIRRGYVAAMSDPRYQLALNAAGDDPVKAQRVEETLGPTAKVDRVVTSIKANRQFLAEDIARLETEAAAIPKSEALTEWSSADNSNWWKVLAKNPVEITAGIMAQSLPAMAPAMAMNMVTPGGRVSKAIATGTGSFGTEAANAYLDSARQTGYDFTNPAKVQEFFTNLQAQADAKAFAIKRGVPIAVFDALTAGIAGKFIEPMLRQGTKKVLIGTAKEVGVQMAGGATGEAAAQLATGQKLSAKDIVAEALGEVASAPSEIISNLRQGKANRAATTAGGASVPASRPVDDELPPAPDLSDVRLQTGTDDLGKPVFAPRATSAAEFLSTPESTKNVPGAAAPTAAAPEQSGGPTQVVPEDPRTITAQMAMLQDGKRSAVLITPGETMPALPDGDRFATVELEGYGTMIYNKRLHKEETILQRAKEDKLGRILGYGVDRKPKPGTEVGVVVVRDPQGVEKQAVVTDQTSLDSVVKAAEKVADAQDAVQLEPAQNVIEQRVAANAPVVTNARQVNDAIFVQFDKRGGRVPNAADLTRQFRDAGHNVEFQEFAPDVGSMAGDVVKFKGTALNQSGAASRIEAESAFKKVFGQSEPIHAKTQAEGKISAKERFQTALGVKPQITERHLAEARQALEVEHPPSVHDDIEGQVTSGAVRFPEADYRDLLDATRDEIAQADYQKPYKKLRKEQRAKVDAQHRISVSAGTPADQVLNAIASANPKYAEWSLDDLAEALSRPPVQTPDSQQVQQLAQEIASLEQSSQPAPRMPVDKISRWFKGNKLIDSTGQPMLVHGKHAVPANRLKDLSGYGIWFTDSLPAARSYDREGASVISVYVKAKNPAVFDAKGERWDSLEFKEGTSTDDLAGWAYANGHDALVVKNVIDDGESATHREKDPLITVVSVKSKSQIVEESQLRKWQETSPTIKAEGARQSISEPGGSSQYKSPASATKPKSPKPVNTFDEAAAAAQKDAIESALDRAIAATNLNRARTLEGVTGAPVWLTKSALNGLLRVVRATYRGTRSLAQAIQAGIEWLRALNLPDFSETEIKMWLAANVTVTANDDDINIREFSDQLEADQPLPPDPARMVANLLYDRRTNESDAAFAMRIMQAVGGPDEAVKTFSDPTNGLPGSVRMFLGQLIIKAYGVTGQHEAAAIFYDNTFAAHITDVAQALQSLNSFLALTPEGKLIWAQKKIQRAANNLVEPVEPQLNAAKQELDAANKAGIEATTAAPDVQAAAREAVDSALDKQAGTPGTELAEAIRKEVLDTLVATGLITAREAEIFRLHLEGTADNSTLAEKLQRAGIPLHDKRADAINQLYKAKTKTEREKIKSRARKARQQQTTKAAVQGDESAIDLAIKRAMQELRVKFGQVIRQHHTVADATGKTLAEKIAAASGLSEADAKKLAEAVAKRFAALVTAKKKAALEKLLKPVKRLAKPHLVDKLVERSNQGALNNEQFWNAVRANLDLPAWSNELSERIRAQVDIIERIPTDQIERKQKAQTDLLNTIERAKGIDFYDLGLAFYKTNLLTGITTTVKNVASTFQNVMAELPVQLLINPSVAADWLIMAGEIIKSGSVQGVQGAWDNWQTGVMTGSRMDKVQAGRVLEQARFGQRGGVPINNVPLSGLPIVGDKIKRGIRYVLESDPGLPYLKMWKPVTLTGNAVKNLAEMRLIRFLNAWKFVTRGLGSQDMIFFKPAEEARAGILALRAAKTLGLKGEAARDHARQMLGYGAKAVATARAQAEAEGLTGQNAARRTAEILHNNRPLELREDARQFALRTTFNNEPYGAFGWIAAMLNQGKTHPSPLIRVPVNLMAPFTDVIANVLNQQLNYTPVGSLRAMVQFDGKLLGHKLQDLSVDQQNEFKRELYAKAVLGTTLLVAIGMKLAQYLDDEDPELAIYGAGPENADDRKGLEAKKWIPHSIKIGNNYFNYGTSQLAIPLAWLGNYQDRLRDARVFKARSAERVAKDLPMMTAGVLAEGALVITEQSFLTGMMQMTEIMSARSAEQRGQALLKLLIRSSTSGVIPNAVRQVDRYFDPNVYEQRTSEGILINNLPFIRGEKGQPSLNNLGLPMQRPLAQQFYSSEAKVPPLVTYLGESGNWPHAPNRNEIYPRRGRTMTEAEYYDYVRGSGALSVRELNTLRAAKDWKTLNREDQAEMVAETISLARQQWRYDHGW